VLVNISLKNIAGAHGRFEEHVRAIGMNNKRIFIEYLPRSNSTDTQVIIFQQDGDKIYAWHACDAAKSGYKYGCWHLALASIVYRLDDLRAVEVVSEPDQFWVQEDITHKYISREGRFKKLTLSPDGGPEPITVEPVIDLPKEHKFLNRYRLPNGILKKVLEFRKKQMDRLTEEQKLRIPQNVKYIPQGNEVAFAVTALLYDTWAPPLLMGPKGSGKSTLVEALAEILHQPLCRISGGIDVNADYLLGCKTLAPVETTPKQLIAKIGVACARTGTPLTAEELRQLSGGQAQMRVVHEPGILLEAVTKGEMILIDEINVLIPEVTSLLHTLLDWQRTITVPGVGEVKAHPDFRLVAAMNVGYMGTRPLNNAFRDRFRGIQVQGISRETLLELLQEKVPEDTARKLADIYEYLYESVYSPAGATLTENCISLRSLLRAAEEISMGVAPEKDIIISCLTESLESASERTQVKDLVEMRL
jgi:MoxR-like ATPase